jgi:dihydroxy-acid dehydratase
MLKAHPLDSAVLLSTCDKDIPAQLMGAASANIPCIMVTGGPMLAGKFRGEDVVCCTDISRYEAELRAGNITEADMLELENCIAPGIGACSMMGTANTMQSMAEALGMTLPGSANIPAVHSKRYWVAEESGRQALELMRNNIKPSDIMTKKSFENAIRVLMALGGSTNAVIHLIAIAHQSGIELDLKMFDKISCETPFIANVKPSGKYTMPDFYEAGGVLAVMKLLEPLLHTDVMTVTGKTLKENLKNVEVRKTDVIAPLDKPLAREGGLVVLFGNLAPDGAIIKVSAASPHLLKHRGRAVVFNSIAEAREKLLDHDFDVSAEDVLVLRYVGPRGAGMPEYGMLPLPRKILERGIRDMVRITDARMSGGHFGTIILHVAPEAAVGGPLAAIETGDMIELDVKRRRIDVNLTDAQIEKRLKEWRPPQPKYKRGYLALFMNSVEQANKGCIFPFM